MAVENSSGTVIGAVLESVGYYTQAEILQRFNSLFIGGGATLYLLALMGAVISVVIYGSFRMGRYLVVGPGLLFFFVFTRTDIKPVVWRIGGENAKSISKFFSGQLEMYRDFTNDHPVQVSWFFAWYTHLIGEITRSMSDVILKNEAQQNLLFIAREQGYRMVTEARLKDSFTMDLVQESLLGEACIDTTSNLLALTDERFTAKIFLKLAKRLWNTGETLDKLRVASIVAEYFDLNTKLKKASDEIMEPGENMKRFIKERTLAKVGGEKLVSRTHDFTELAEPRFEAEGNSGLTQEEEFAEFIYKGGKDGKKFAMKCGAAWTVALDAIKIQAIQQEKELYKNIFYYWNMSEMHDLYQTAISAASSLGGSFLEPIDPMQFTVCEVIVKKLYGGDLKHIMLGTSFLQDPTSAVSSLIGSGGCSLSDSISLYMLKNMNETTFGEAARRASGQRYSSTLSPSVRDFDQEGYGVESGRSGIWGARGSQAGDKVDCPSGSACSIGLNIKSDFGVTIASKNDEAFNAQMEYQARGLMRQIFNYSLQVPYWQGMLLYLLSIAYPFFAIIVVLPGKASSFFFLPLAWFWVKSWDVGFALVRVFDEILWELMPGKSLNFQNVVDSVVEMATKLFCGFSDFYIPGRLRQVMIGDVGADLYQHYFFVSIGTFAVPGITGALIMKGRHSALASFSHAAQSYAEEYSYEQKLYKDDLNLSEGNQDPYTAKLSQARNKSAKSLSSQAMDTAKQSGSYASSDTSERNKPSAASSSSSASNNPSASSDPEDPNNPRNRRRLR